MPGVSSWASEIDWGVKMSARKLWCLADISDMAHLVIVFTAKESACEKMPPA